MGSALPDPLRRGKAKTKSDLVLNQGHHRPHLNLALNVLHIHPSLKITFIGNIDNDAKCKAELSRHGSYKDRLDLQLLGNVMGEGSSWDKSFKAEEIIAIQYEVIYRNLLKVWPTSSGTPRPTLVLWRR